MKTKIFHGNIKAKDLATALVARFNNTNLKAQSISSGEIVTVQIATRVDAISGGQTAIGVTIQQNEDGITVKQGKQDWLGTAASIGKSLLYLKLNPLNILSRLDDIAQDIENINLDDKIWDVIHDVAKTQKASHKLSEKFLRSVCEYCNTANSYGNPRCMACGAPLGDVQPVLCSNCGFVADIGDTICSNCGQDL